MLLPALAVLTVGASVAGGALLADRGLAWALVGLIAAYLVVLAAKPTWTALAAIGPNPSEGGRFYGSSNLTTSILLTVALFAAGTLGRGSVIPIALLSIVTVGWSRAGADGGGIVVLVAAFAALWILLANGRLTARALAVAGALAVGVGLALVGLDAATGGSSHVTRKVGRRPDPSARRARRPSPHLDRPADDVVACRARVRDRYRRARSSSSPGLRASPSATR